MNVGIIGRGFVGDAVYQNLDHTLAYDIEPSRSDVESIEELCNKCKFIYVCLPTPMNSDGSSNVRIIESALEEANRYATDRNIFILKSTVPPGTSRKILLGKPNIQMVFSPEFLTEANYILDFKNCNRVIFGGPESLADRCVSFAKETFPNKEYITTDFETAEMIKYFINNFLTVKVAFANEMKQVCDATGISYDDVKNIALLDKRIGPSHLSVPGPDGELGFGGTCFPKDINAMITYSTNKGVDCKILRSAWTKNLDIRENKDWLTMYGRAVVEPEE
jgi:UDPglucose 6-dehydrogenase